MCAIHQNLQTRVTHEEWGKLNEAEETEVARAFTRRYKAYAPTEAQVKRDGVKRIDYLKRNTWFKGLVWMSPDNGVERLKLLMGTNDT